MCNWLVLVLSTVNCALCLEQPKTITNFFWSVNLLIVSGMKLEIEFPQNYKSTLIKLSRIHKLFGFQENCIDYKFLNNLMLFTRFFIYCCKYSKSKPIMLEYFNVLNMIKESECISAKRNKSLDKHYKKWRYICNSI